MAAPNASQQIQINNLIAQIASPPEGVLQATLVSQLAILRETVMRGQSQPGILSEGEDTVGPMNSSPYAGNRCG